MRVLKAIFFLQGVLALGNEVIADDDDDYNAPDGNNAGPPDEDGEEKDDQVEGRTRFRMFKNGVWGIMQKSEDEGKVERTAITMGVDAFWEKDEEGNPVGTCRNQPRPCTRHGTRFFRRAKKEFTVERNQTVGEARGHHVNVKHDAGAGNFELDVYFIKAKGEVGPNLTDEDAPRWDGEPGTVKFAFNFSSWAFCTPDTCKEQKNGAFIDLRMFIKSLKAGKAFRRKEGDEVKNGRGRNRFAMAIGETVDLDFTNEVLVDGSVVEMPEGYPKLTTKSRQIRGKTVTWQELLFRFPKFNQSAVYDPVIEGADEPENGAFFGGPGVAAFLALAWALRM